MIHLIRGAALIGALTMAAPVWAHAPLTAEDLNRLELNRIATTTTAAPPITAAPGFVPDPVGLIVADGIRPGPARFPGLLTIGGLGLAAVGSVLDTVVVGGPPQY